MSRNEVIRMGLDKLLERYEDRLRSSYEEILSVLNSMDRTLREILKELKRIQR